MHIIYIYIYIYIYMGQIGGGWSPGGILIYVPFFPGQFHEILNITSGSLAQAQSIASLFERIG